MYRRSATILMLRCLRNVFFVAVLFFGDPHFLTIDGRNYTFNGYGEYTMLDYDNGSFVVQARTGLLAGTTTATIFTAAAVKETNASTVEVRVKNGGTDNVLLSLLFTWGRGEQLNRA